MYPGIPSCQRDHRLLSCLWVQRVPWCSKLPERSQTVVLSVGSAVYVYTGVPSCQRDHRPVVLSVGSAVYVYTGVPSCQRDHRLLSCLQVQLCMCTLVFQAAREITDCCPVYRFSCVPWCSKLPERAAYQWTCWCPSGWLWTSQACGRCTGSLDKLCITDSTPLQSSSFLILRTRYVWI